MKAGQMLAVCVLMMISFGECELVGRWTFGGVGGLRDETKRWASAVETFGYAKMVSEGLLVTNGGWARVRGYSGPDIREKTLISWLKLNGVPNFAAGSAITLDSITGDSFDGIVWGEQINYAWTAGSSNWLRTNTANAPIFNQDNKIVKMAVTYQDIQGTASVKLYMDDQLLMSYSKGPIATWTGSNSEVIFGARHTIVDAPHGYLEAMILGAEIHNTALSATEIAGRTLDDASGFIKRPVALRTKLNVNNYVKVVGEGPFVTTGPVSGEADQARSNIYIVPGLADYAGVSLQVSKPPGQFLCFRDSTIQVCRNDGTSSFRNAATFVPVITGAEMKFKLYDQPTQCVSQGPYLAIAPCATTDDQIFVRATPIRQPMIYNYYLDDPTTEIPLDENHWYVIVNPSQPDKVLHFDGVTGVVNLQSPKNDVFQRSLWRLERMEDAGVHRWRLIGGGRASDPRYLDGSGNNLVTTTRVVRGGQHWAIRPISWVGADYFTMSNDDMGNGFVLNYDLHKIDINLRVNERRWRFIAVGAIGGSYRAVLNPDSNLQSVFPKYTAALGVRYMATHTVSEWALQSARMILSNVMLSFNNRSKISQFSGVKILILGDNDVNLLDYPYYDGAQDDWRGGTRSTELFVTEEMMGRKGVTNRPSDTLYRRFDQLVHEFGHNIDMNLNLNAPSNPPWNGMGTPAEQFPTACQSWFNANGDVGGSRSSLPTDQFNYLKDNVFDPNREWYTPPIVRG